MPTSPPFILGLGGTMRFGSSSERALRYALDRAEQLGATTRLLAGARLELPMYDPATDLGEAAQELVALVARCDGLLIASPSYHGGVSGLLKNALDHTEALRRDARPYLEGRAVGCIATGDGWQGANATLTALRATVHALRGWPTPLGVAQNIADVDGVTGAHAQLTIVASQVVEFAHAQRALRAAAAEAPREPVHAAH